jgi:hypothetical protein
LEQPGGLTPVANRRRHRGRGILSGLWRLWLWCALISATVLGLSADTRSDAEELQQPLLPVPAPAQAQPGPPEAQSPQTPSAINHANAELVVTLVRTALIAVDQANATGNYTVLRDLGAPSFRDKNSAADLARIFAPIRDQKINLAPVVLLDPQITRANLDNQNMLHIAGALATKPAVNFELLFQPIGGVWRIYGVAITPVADAPRAQPNPVAAAPTGSNRGKPPPRAK